MDVLYNRSRFKVDNKVKSRTETEANKQGRQTETENNRRQLTPVDKRKLENGMKAEKNRLV